MAVHRLRVSSRSDPAFDAVLFARSSGLQRTGDRSQGGNVTSSGRGPDMNGRALLLFDQNRVDGDCLGSQRSSVYIERIDLQSGDGNDRSSTH
jgi:hypothetical protein